MCHCRRYIHILFNVYIALRFLHGRHTWPRTGQKKGLRIFRCFFFLFFQMHQRLNLIRLNKRFVSRVPETRMCHINKRREEIKSFNLNMNICLSTWMMCVCVMYVKRVKVYHVALFCFEKDLIWVRTHGGLVHYYNR